MNPNDFKTSVRRFEHGQLREVEEVVAEERAVALVYNGVSHAVMMATPEDLEDFAFGFSLTENIIEEPSQLYDVHPADHALGIELNINIASGRFALLNKRRRNLTGRTGCGLCGAESLEHAIRPVQKVGAVKPIPAQAIAHARISFSEHQPLQAITGAVHGAAWCDRTGEVIVLREDVGRHNALDKLLGSLARSGFEPEAGFVFISSRISYEMVQKVSAFDIAVLAAVSAPTRLAIEIGEQSGVTLIAFVREGRHSVYTTE
ncbi:MAG: formate dehydrogenase accessory sulfurtransferase FdhD [Gammaproteobacteria bacterium]|nr:formate dehydrogenase accessory sulfurtransferase FdhD [Gammaproteobacteria bacterium]